MRLLSLGHILDLGEGVARPQPAPTRAEIAAALDDNICRCGAHRKGSCVWSRAPPRVCARRHHREPRSPRSGAGGVAAVAERQSAAQSMGAVRNTWAGYRINGTGRDRPGCSDGDSQIAADELDVCPDRIDLRTGDTTLIPNEGYTAGSKSIQFGGIAMRLVCGNRGLFLAAAASRLNCAASRSLHNGRRGLA